MNDTPCPGSHHHTTPQDSPTSLDMNVAEKKEDTVTEVGPPSSPSVAPPYSAFSTASCRLILSLVTAAGFFGPLCGAIYLPSLPLFENVFHTSTTGINASVTLYMVIFAITVCAKSSRVYRTPD